MRTRDLKNVPARGAAAVETLADLTAAEKLEVIEPLRVAKDGMAKEVESGQRCNWKHCPGWTIDWLGFVKPCGQCQRFDPDDEDGAATVAREFIASFAVLPREDGKETCDPNCLGWAVFERQGSEMPGFDIERCDDCGMYADDDDALTAAVKWLIEHLSHPERYPRKSAKKTIRDKVNVAARAIAAAHGWKVPETHDFSSATEGRSQQFWRAATAAYEAFFGDRPDLDAEVDDEATHSGARREVPKGAGVSLKETVGRTIARLERGTTEGAYGEEPTVTFIFTDGAYHAFVLARDEGNDREDAHG